MSSLVEGTQPYFEVHIQTLSYSSVDALSSVVQQANTNISGHRDWLEKLPYTTSARALELRQEPGPPSTLPIPAACTSLLTSALSAASSSASANIAPSLALLQASVSSANDAFNLIRDSAAAALSTASSSMNSAAAALSTASSSIDSAKAALSTASSSIDSANAAAAAASSSAFLSVASIQSSASSAVVAAQRSGSLAVEVAMSSVTSANSARTKAQSTTKLALAITFSIIGSSLLSVLIYHLISRHRCRRRWQDQDRPFTAKHSPASSRSQPMSRPMSRGDALAHSESVVNLERERTKKRQSIARDRAKSIAGTSVRDFGLESESGRKSLGDRDIRSRDTIGSISQFPLPRGRVPSLPSMAQIYDSAQAENHILPPHPPPPSQPALAFELMQQREAEARKRSLNRPDPHPGQISSLNPEAQRVQAWLAHPPLQRVRNTGETVERDNRVREEHPLRRNPSQDFIPPRPSRDSSLHYGTNMGATPAVPKARWSIFPPVKPNGGKTEDTEREIQKALEKARAQIPKASEKNGRPRSRKTTLIYDPYRPDQPPAFETMWVDDEGDYAVEEETHYGVEDASTTLYESFGKTGSNGVGELVASPTSETARKSMAGDLVNPSILSSRTLPGVIAEEERKERDGSPESVMREAYGGREFPPIPKSDPKSGAQMGEWLKEGMMGPRESKRISESKSNPTGDQALLGPRSLRRQILAEGGIKIPARSPRRMSAGGNGIGKAI